MRPTMQDKLSRFHGKLVDKLRHDWRTRPEDHLAAYRLMWLMWKLWVYRPERVAGRGASGESQP